MNFFKTLSESGITDVIIQFEQSEKGEVTVFVSPKAITNTNAIRLLKPIFLKGSAEEVDSVFYENLAKHMIDISDALKEEIATAKIEKSKTTTKAKAKTAPEMLKEVVQPTTQATEKTTATMEIVKEEVPVAEETHSITETVVPEVKAKVVKTNNEKELKTFMATIDKDDNIFNHKDAIEFLLGNLTEEELAKPYNAGIKKDLDDACKKEAQKIAFRLANGYKKETAPDAVEEPVEVEKVIAVDVIDNVAFVTTEVIEQEVEQQVETVVEQVVEQSQPAIEIQEEVAEIVVAQQEEVAQVEPIVVSAAPAPVIKTELQFRMIAVDYTYEQYIAVGWTNETLVENGYAHWVEVAVQ